MSLTKIQFDSKGNPILAVGKTASYVSVTKKHSKANFDKAVLSKKAVVKSDVDDKGVASEVEFAYWGSANDWPNNTALGNYLKKSTVLRSAINYKTRLALGQGVFACTVTGYDEDGNEQLQVINDKNVNKFLRSTLVKRYLYKAFHDIYSFGICFPQMIWSSDNKRIANIHVLDAPWCRLSTKNENGIIENVLVSGNWPYIKEDIRSYDVLDISDGIDVSIERSRKFKSFFYPAYIPVSGYPYYPSPDWTTAQESKWLDIAIEVPKMLSSIFTNQMSIKYHVRIPYEYWESKYPKTVYRDEKERQSLIQTDLDELEKELTTSDNANKTIITHFKVNDRGTAEEKWDIEVIDDKMKEGAYLPQSAAANSEILFSMSVNPSVKGAGMPGGPYAGNAGSGSDIREAFLIDVALAWADRQFVLDPLEFMLTINFPNISDDIELRFRNTILTTLDKGKGTEKVVS